MRRRRGGNQSQHDIYLKPVNSQSSLHSGSISPEKGLSRNELLGSHSKLILQQSRGSIPELRDIKRIPSPKDKHLADTLNIYKSYEPHVPENMMGPKTFIGGDPEVVIQRHKDIKLRQAKQERAIKRALRK